MDNESLVELVEMNEIYLEFKSPRDPKVLEAMRKVDRRNFLPDEERIYCLAYKGGLEKLQQALEETSKSIIEIMSGSTEREFSVIMDIFMKNVRSMAVAGASVLSYVVELPLNLKDLAYNDCPWDIGYGQTCSQPSMVGFMCDVLELKPGMRVLEVGAGCGYHAAVAAEIIGESGHVFSVECVPPLVELARKNLNEHFGERTESRVTVIQGDGSLGLPEQAPFDRIYFTAGVDLSKFQPIILARQLKPQGVLLYPQQNGLMLKEKYHPSGEVEDVQVYEDVLFVPLRGENGGKVWQKALMEEAG